MTPTFDEIQAWRQRIKNGLEPADREFAERILSDDDLLTYALDLMALDDRRESATGRLLLSSLIHAGFVLDRPERIAERHWALVARGGGTECRRFAEASWVNTCFFVLEDGTRRDALLESSAELLAFATGTEPVIARRITLELFHRAIRPVKP